MKLIQQINESDMIQHNFWLTHEHFGFMKYMSVKSFYILEYFSRLNRGNKKYGIRATRNRKLQRAMIAYVMKGHSI